MRCDCYNTLYACTICVYFLTTFSCFVISNDFHCTLSLMCLAHTLTSEEEGDEESYEQESGEPCVMLLVLLFAVLC